MTRNLLMLAAAALGVSACDNNTNANEAAPQGAKPEAASAATTSIGEYAANTADLSMLAGAVKASGLNDALVGPGPYTLFAPSNAAFEALPPGTAEGLMQPAQKAQLTGLLTGHIVPGVVTAEDLGRAIETGKGKAQLATMAGATLTATRDGDAIVLTDAAGSQARVVKADLIQSNGVIHMVDALLRPAS